MTVVREIRNETDVLALARLGQANKEECAPNLSFDPQVVVRNGCRVLMDTERQHCNVWIAWNGDTALGYAVGQNAPFFYNNDYSAMLSLVFILPEHRGGWAYIKLVKSFEEWARLNGAVRLSVGVERSEKDEAKHIRALFPKMGYQWAGSNYLKEITR